MTQCSILYEANIFSANQEIALIPIQSQKNPVYVIASSFLKVILILFFHYTWVFQVVSFHQVFPPKPCIYFSSPPYMPHAPAILVNSIIRIIFGEEYKPNVLLNVISPVSCCCLLGPNLLQHPVLEPSLLFPEYERPSFIPI